ncbi:MAG: DNA cytosine methyltransferase [Euryarchaeota archaeon]|nr:DNA cytosine methyltransferase [Euryarchaeota archaeon]
MSETQQRSGSKVLRVLDLCSGMNGWTAAFRAHGHDAWGLELEASFEPELNMDVRLLAKAPGALLDILVGPGWRPDVILASPPCEGFSVASIGKMWEATPHGPVPKHATSRYGLSVLNGVLAVNSGLQPRYTWIENPRGMMRKMPQMQALRRTTVSYCQYGETRAKPSDLWGRWPSTWSPRPMCTGDPANGLVDVEGKTFVLDRLGRACHESAPRGAKTGTQGLATSALRAVIPYALSDDVRLASESAFQLETGLTPVLEVVAMRQVPDANPAAPEAEDFAPPARLTGQRQPTLAAYGGGRP